MDTACIELGDRLSHLPTSSFFHFLFSTAILDENDCNQRMKGVYREVVGKKLFVHCCELTSDPKTPLISKLESMIVRVSSKLKQAGQGLMK